MRDSLQLDADVLNELFPFHISCGRELNIVAVGPSLQKLLPREVIGLPLGEAADVEKLYGGNDYASLCQQHGQLVVLQIRDTPKMKLRGQTWIQGDLIHFLVSLRCEDPQSLIERGLTVGDYAGHDAALEAMFLKQSCETTLSELHEVIDRLEEAIAQKERHLTIESGLINDLNAAGDIRIRTDANGLVTDLWVANENCCSQPIAEYIDTSLEKSFPDAWRSIQNCEVQLTAGKTIAVSFSVISGHFVRHYEARVAMNAEGKCLLLGRDVTDRIHLEARLEEAALHDPLTGLANRRLFSMDGEYVVKSGSTFAILLIDIDDFKTINDSLGHQVGDELLYETASRILDKLRVGDTAARLGGDEFGILLRGPVTQEYAENFAAEIEQWISQPMNINDVELTPRVSVGVATSHGDQGIDDVLSDADFAMYTAKRDSDRAIMFCDTKLRESMRERNAIKQALQSAQLEEEFVPFYQPIIDFNSGRIAAVEALVRWKHPERGLLTPYHFLDVAAEMGLLKDIGYSVLSKACSQVHDLREAFDEQSLCVNVNLCRLQAVDEELWLKVRKVLKESELAPEFLNLEITESALIDDFEKAKRIFLTLRENGVGVALDDFGIGYSSLSYLQEFPISRLKLDRSLVQDICENKKQRDMFACVHQLGVTLGMSIVAEGIETEEQARLIHGLGCDFGQGYLFAKPMSFDELIQRWTQFDFQSHFRRYDTEKEQALV